MYIFLWQRRKKEKRLLYDIGIDNQVAVKAEIGKMPYSYQPSIRCIRKFAPSCLILSHWDADHYKACVYGGKSIFDCTWIAPDLKDASINAKRLEAYLYSIGKMMFVDRSAGRAIKVDLTSYSTLTLYIGNNAGVPFASVSCWQKQRLDDGPLIVA